MLANNPSRLPDKLDQLDEALCYLRSLCSAFELLAEHMGQCEAGKGHEAFWTLLASARTFIADGQRASDEIHKITKGAV